MPPLQQQQQQYGLPPAIDYVNAPPAAWGCFGNAEGGPWQEVPEYHRLPAMPTPSYADYANPLQGRAGYDNNSSAAGVMPYIVPAPAPAPPPPPPPPPPENEDEEEHPKLQRRNSRVSFVGVFDV
ncbi:hypothetical protein DQ04_01011170 [Trypanosoma grayi]|uniref:hypothetical protein n=1 Tax=Trypanosoma grayi TaxID=71804 RepID=UPI0004F48135|nr:hypothetical protein DQ04_01011170 [Trypanosoma grayi]KEG13434.1 hypothetical protein DQ04_01011170 [Trypanosoma grayi]